MFANGEAQFKKTAEDIFLFLQMFTWTLQKSYLKPVMLIKRDVCNDVIRGLSFHCSHWHTFSQYWPSL